jgi:Domain of unknown function (DUF4349)
MKTNLKQIVIFSFCSVILFGCGGGDAAKVAYNKDFLDKDSLMKDSIVKVEAAAALENKSESPSLVGDLNTKTNAPKDRNFIKTANIMFRVNNVRIATEKIEDLVAKFGGYVKSSNLANRTENSSREKFGKDSLLISQQIVVENQMVLRIPNEKLDSLLRSMNFLINFLDYRIYNMDDVTFQLIKNLKDAGRLKKYDQRQTAHIEQKDAKLKETSHAEDNLLDKQRQSDNIQINNLELADQVHDCTITLHIYQKPIIIREMVENFNSYQGYQPAFFKRVWGSILFGWTILEEIIVFIFNLWGILLLVMVVWFVVRIFFKPKDPAI